MDPSSTSPPGHVHGRRWWWERLQSYEAEFGADDNTVVALLEGEMGTPAGIAWLRTLHAAVEDLQASWLFVHKCLNGDGNDPGNDRCDRRHR